MFSVKWKTAWKQEQRGSSESLAKTFSFEQFPLSPCLFIIRQATLGLLCGILPETGPKGCNSVKATDCTSRVVSSVMTRCQENFCQQLVLLQLWVTGTYIYVTPTLGCRSLTIYDHIFLKCYALNNSLHRINGCKNREKAWIDFYRVTRCLFQT